MKSRKRLARDVFDTVATHVYDVADTNCWAQNGSTHGRSFATSKQCFSFLPFSSKRDEKSSYKLLRVYFKLQFLSTRLVVLVRFGDEQKNGQFSKVLHWS